MSEYLVFIESRGAAPKIVSAAACVVVCDKGHTRIVLIESGDDEYWDVASVTGGYFQVKPSFQEAHELALAIRAGTVGPSLDVVIEN